MFQRFANQNKRLCLALAALLAVAAGLLAGHYRMMLRASEDAYATMLWRQSAKTAGRLEGYFQELLAHMAGISMTDPTAGLLETEYAADIAAMQRLDETGSVTGTWAPHPETVSVWPAELTPEQWGQLQKGLPVVACHTAQHGTHGVTIHAPIFQGNSMEGAVGVLINTDSLIWRCFPPLDEPLIAGFALYAENGAAIAEAARPETAGHLPRGAVLRAGPLLTAPEHGMAAYRLVRHTGGRYLAATAPAMLPGQTTWLAASSIAYATVAKAPRALLWRLAWQSLIALLLAAGAAAGAIYGWRHSVQLSGWWRKMHGKAGMRRAADTQPPASDEPPAS